MSADNGVYILKTPRWPVKEGNYYTNQHGKFDYRVAHCQAIDNIDYSDLYLPCYFGNSQVHDNEDDAWKEARQIAEDVDFLEYGVSIIEKQFYPNMSQETASKALDVYVGAKPV